MNDKFRNRLLLITVLLMLGLLKPWRAEIHKPAVDGVVLGMTGEAVLAAWGKPHTKEDGGRFWAYSIAKSVELNSDGQVVAVSGSTLTLDGTKVPCRTAWITKQVLGPPTRVSYGDSLGDAWVFETSDNFLLVLAVMDRYTHYEIISVGLRPIE